MILVFDLDDTLYDEITFVKSGFCSVADYLNATFGIPQSESFDLMVAVLETKGRGKIFDITLDQFQLKNKKNILKCLHVYRTHDPNIKLFKTAEKCFERFSSHTKYLVTDGNKVVQDKKVRALNLYGKFSKVLITHRYGLKHAKPSPYCFLKIAKLERSIHSDIVYIGDNPTKDFIGIKPLGFKTVRVLTGNYKDLRLSEAHEADISIPSLDHLTHSLIGSL